jgi:hypothetical protein
LLRESRHLRHSRQRLSHARCILRVSLPPGRRRYRRGSGSGISSWISSSARSACLATQCDGASCGSVPWRGTLAAGARQRSQNCDRRVEGGDTRFPEVGNCFGFDSIRRLNISRREHFFSVSSSRRKGRRGWRIPGGSIVCSKFGLAMSPICNQDARASAEPRDLFTARIGAPVRGRFYSAEAHSD